MAQSYEIVNSKTHVRFGRKFDTRKEANEFIKYLQANTNLKLNWVAKPWPYKREGNPTVSVSSLPIGTWQPAHAIRQNADGTVDILREKNSGRRANISEGFMAGGVFHPIRSASDYDAGRVGEGRTYKKKRKKGTKPAATGRRYAAKKASSKPAMATSRREYGGDGSRYRNPSKKPTKAQVNAAWRKYDAYVKKSEKTGQYSELYANRLMLSAQLLQKEYQDFR